MWIQSRYQPHIGGAPYLWGGTSGSDYLTTFDQQGAAYPNSPTAGPFQMLAFGGANIQAHADVIPALSPGGSHTVTIGYRPDAVIFVTNRDRNGVRPFAPWYPNPFEDGEPSAELYYGVADRFGNQWCGAFWALWVYRWDPFKHNYWNEGCCLGAGDPTGFPAHTQVPIQAVATMTSTGFRLDYDAGFDGWTNVYYLALRSPTLGMRAGVLTTPVAPGVQSVALPFQPGAIWTVTACEGSAQDTWAPSTVEQIAMGMWSADGDGYFNTSYRHTQNATHNNTALIQVEDASGTSNKATVAATPSGFDLTYSVSNAARRVGYLAWETDQLYDGNWPIANLHQNAALVRNAPVSGSQGAVSIGVASAPTRGFSAGAYMSSGDMVRCGALDAAINLVGDSISWYSANLYHEVSPTIPQAKPLFLYRRRT